MIRKDDGRIYTNETESRYPEETMRFFTRPQGSLVVITIFQYRHINLSPETESSYKLDLFTPIWQAMSEDACVLRFSIKLVDIKSVLSWHVGEKSLGELGGKWKPLKSIITSDKVRLIFYILWKIVQSQQPVNGMAHCACSVTNLCMPLSVVLLDAAQNMSLSSLHSLCYSDNIWIQNQNLKTKSFNKFAQ